MNHCYVRCSSSVSLSSLAVSLAALLCLFEAALTACDQWTSNEISKHLKCFMWFMAHISLTFLLPLPSSAPDSQPVCEQGGRLVWCAFNGILCSCTYFLWFGISRSLRLLSKVRYFIPICLSHRLVSPRRSKGLNATTGCAIVLTQQNV